MTPVDPSTTEQRWPADQFYWASFDASDVAPRGRARHQQLMYRLEEFLPVEAESVHAVFIRLEGTRVLAIAAGRSRLGEAAEGGAEVVRPESLPTFVQEQLPAEISLDGLLQSINLLSGPCEPQRVITLRRRLAWSLATSISVIAMLIGAGALRRANTLDHAAEESRARVDSVIVKALGERSTQSSLPPSLQLVAQLRRLEQLADGQGGATRPDVALELAAVLGAWPAAVPLRLDGLLVSGDSASIRWRSTSAVEVQPVVDALSGLQGWSAEQPQLRTQGAESQASLVLRRARQGAAR